MHNLKMCHGSLQRNASLFSAADCTAQVCREHAALPKSSNELMKQGWELSNSWPCTSITGATQPQEYTCLREKVSSKSRATSYFYWLYSKTHNFCAWYAKQPTNFTRFSLFQSTDRTGTKADQRWGSPGTRELWQSAPSHHQTSPQRSDPRPRGEGDTARTSAGTSEESLGRGGERSCYRKKLLQNVKSCLSETVQLLYAGSLSLFCVMVIPETISAIFHSLTHVFLLRQALNRDPWLPEPSHGDPFQKAECSRGIILLRLKL